MAFFHTHIITGPIHSRRLGSSLGVNLSSTKEKVCNYNCVYCECGWNTEWTGHPTLPTCGEVEGALDTALAQLHEDGKRPDSITFSGNGEPTLHPDFPAVIAATLRSARKHFPDNPPIVTVISNATQIGRPEIVDALSRCNKVLLKLDAGTPHAYALINRLQKGFQLDKISVEQSAEEFYPQLVENLAAYPHPYTLQTLLFRGEYENERIDNASGSEWEAYKDRLKRIQPPAIMLYGLDRETPAKKLIKLSAEELEARAEELRALGFNATAFF